MERLDFIAERIPNSYYITDDAFKTILCYNTSTSNCSWAVVQPAQLALIYLLSSNIMVSSAGTEVYKYRVWSFRFDSLINKLNYVGSNSSTYKAPNIFHNIYRNGNYNGTTSGVNLAANTIKCVCDNINKDTTKVTVSQMKIWGICRMRDSQ